MSSRLSGITALLILLLTVVACTRGPERSPAIGEAFAGPATLNLRAELAPGTKVVGSVRHGDRLEIVQTRRRFVKVRTTGGIEGWTDTRQLLTAEQMAELRALAAGTAKRPSQGSATVYDTLNVHTHPLRQSPSFYQIREGVQVEVIDHKLVAKASAAPPAPPLVKPPAPVRKKKRKHSEETRIAPPPRPSPPGLPPNWQELSRRTAPPETQTPVAEEVEKKPSPRPAMEDWTLVRTQDGRAGWVLTRNLIMAIPDEVAQYAEGHRITSYFPMREVHDDEQGVKQDWLWTTIRAGGENYQFDGLRYFIWNQRKHRYETNYIERDLEGYYPVTVQPGPSPRFSVIVREKDGKLYRRNYVWDVYRIRLAGSEPWTSPPEPPAAAEFPSELASSEPERREGSPSLRERLFGWTKRLLHK